MDCKQRLFEIFTKTFAFLTSLVLFFLTHHRAKSNKPLDFDTFDYDQTRIYMILSDCPPEYIGFFLKGGVCSFPVNANSIWHLPIFI